MINVKYLYILLVLLLPAGATLAQRSPTSGLLGFCPAAPCQMSDVRFSVRNQRTVTGIVVNPGQQAIVWIEGSANTQSVSTNGSPEIRCSARSTPYGVANWTAIRGRFGAPEDSEIRFCREVVPNLLGLGSRVGLAGVSLQPVGTVTNDFPNVFWMDNNRAVTSLVPNPANNSAMLVLHIAEGWNLFDQGEYTAHILIAGAPAPATQGRPSP